MMEESQGDGNFWSKRDRNPDNATVSISIPLTPDEREEIERGSALGRTLNYTIAPLQAL